MEFEFEAERRQIFIERLRVSILQMGVPILVGFILVDYCYRPDMLSSFLKYRITIIPFAVLILYLLKSKRVIKRFYTFPAHLFTLYLSLVISYIAFQTGMDHSLYYAGLNLIGVGSLSFLPWKRRGLIINTATIYLPFYFFVAIYKAPLDPSFLITETAFIICTIMLGVITNYLGEKSRLREFTARMKLEEENTSKARVIQEKTKEGVYLQRLASQFSPQVIEAIRTGAVQIDKKVRRKITVIFIDVEKSTAGSRTLDHGDYESVLGDFFSSTIKILLSHNITIGTYLGDGLLAFINAPFEVPRHAETAVRAGLEVLNMTHKRRSYYMEKWRTNFNIRIGIHSGFASIGFFPNSLLGTYTALGEEVNLAARLCSAGETNCICLAKSTLRDVTSLLEGLTVRPRKKEDTNLKGFDGQTIELFSLSDTKVVEETYRSADSCPLCGGTMAVQLDLNESELIKCNSCQYADIIPKAGARDLGKKAA